MRRHNVSPSYTEAARKQNVGVADSGMVPAYFQMIDGQLHVVTDEALATHSWERWNGRVIVSPYRSDSTMVLGNGRTTLAPTYIPDSYLVMAYWPGIDWPEFLGVFTRASEASYMAEMPEIVGVASILDPGTLTRASEASYMGEEA